MNIETTVKSTIITKKIATFTEWLQDILLPEDVREEQPTIETIRDAMLSWNAAEVGDAISQIIMSVVFDANGEPDMAAARRFSTNELVQRGVGLRRGSRLVSVRNREKLPMAWAALRETLDITLELVRERNLWIDEVVEEERVEIFDYAANEAVAVPYGAFDGLAYDSDRSIDGMYSRMADDDEMMHWERQDAEFSLVTEPATRERLRHEIVLYGKLNRDRLSDRHRSKRSRKAVLDSRAMNATLRQPALRRANAPA